MRKLLAFLFAALIAFAGFGQVSDVQVNTDINQVRIKGAGDPARVALPMQDLHNSKISTLALQATGTDTYVVSNFNAQISSYLSGQTFPVYFQNANTGAATININGIGAKSLVKNASTPLAAADIAAGRLIWIYYDGTNFRVSLPGSGGGGSGTVTSILTSGPITGGPITTNGTIGISNAIADGSTKGAATFSAGDFNDDGSGVITIDYINGQSASSSLKGLLSAADWNTFNNKQSAITGGASTITTSNLTINRALVSDGSGKVSVAATTATEIGYVSGVTSAIQTQFAGKQPLNTNLTQISALTPANNQIFVYNGSAWILKDATFDPTSADGDLIARLSGVISRIGIGTNGQVLTVVGGIPAWANAAGGGSVGGDLAGTLPNPTLAIDRWKLTGTSLYTGLMTLSGTLTETANSQAVLTAGGTFTLDATTSHVGYYWLLNPTIVSGAGSQSASVLRIVPVFTGTGGAFGSTNILEMIGSIGTLKFDGNGSLRLISRGLSFDDSGVGASSINFASGTSSIGSTGGSADILSFNGGSGTSGNTRFQFSRTFAPITGSTGAVLTLFQHNINQTGSANGGTGVLEIATGATAMVGAHKQLRLYTVGTANPTNPFTSISIEPTTGTGTFYGLVTTSTSILNGFGTATPSDLLHVFGNLRIGGGTSAGLLKFMEPSGSGSNFTTISAVAQSADINYTWPASAPASNGYVLSSTTAGALSWVGVGTIGGSTGSTDQAFIVANGTGGSTVASTDLTFNSSAGSFSGIIYTALGARFDLATKAVASSGSSTSDIQLITGTIASGTGSGKTGDVYISPGAISGTASKGNIALNTVVSGVSNWQSMQGGLFIANATADASAAISSGVTLWAKNSRLVTMNDFAYMDDTKGPILKSSDGHFWRVSVSTLGVLSTSDLGTSLP